MKSQNPENPFAPADSLGHPEIVINFSNAGTRQFAEVTRQNLHKRLAIIIDGQLCEAPNVLLEISDGNANISGSFSKRKARDFAAKINDALAQK